MADNSLANQQQNNAPAASTPAPAATNTTAGSGTPPTQSNAGGSKNFRFPPNIESLPYFAKFDFYEYNRKSFGEETQGELQFSVALPVPANLQERFSLNYSAPGLDPIVGLMARKDMEKSIDDYARSSKTEAAAVQFGQGVMNTLKNTMSALMADASTSPAQAAYVAAKTANFNDISNAIARYEGVAINPYVALQFQSPELRSHSFSYRFSPSNKNESLVVREMIRKISLAIHPSLNGSKTLYTYPNIVRVTIGKTAWDGSPALYKIYDSFVTSFSINYAPNGPAFFNSGYSDEINPVEIGFDISLQETSPLTRETIEKGYNGL